VAVHQQATGSIVEIGFLPDVDVLERVDQVDHAPRVDVHAEAAQQAPEKQEVVDEVLRTVHRHGWI
jgi:hypothetical protein